MRESFVPRSSRVARVLLTVAGIAAASAFSPSLADAQPAKPVYEPRIGQPGRDAVWVPTSPEMVEKMLDVAGVAASDFVIDLGSGDGRVVIAAARRGARSLGVEFNEDLVALSRQKAEEAGVADRASFVRGDMYEADISKATVLALFLLPENLNRILPTIQALPPGTRVVVNTFAFDEWEADERHSLEGGSCGNWCEALLWIVPARVGGTWQLAGEGTLRLTQLHQVLSGTLAGPSGETPVSQARMRGDAIAFSAGDAAYVGRVSGDVMEGQVVVAGKPARPWKAIRVP